MGLGLPRLLEKNPDFPLFFGTPCFFFCVLARNSFFAFVPTFPARDFRGSVGIKNPCFFLVVPFPDPPILTFFFLFPCFFCVFRFSLFVFFLCVLPSFSKDLRGSAKRKPLPFSGFSLFFFKEARAGGSGLSNKNKERKDRERFRRFRFSVPVRFWVNIRMSEKGG